MKNLLSFFLAGLLCWLVAPPAVTACEEGDCLGHPLSLALLEQRGDIPAGTRQVLLVSGDPATVFGATVRAMEKEDGAWREKLPPFRAVIGRNGFAEFGQKREGDGKTPSGVFTLPLAFGYTPDAPTRMPYRQATEPDQGDALVIGQGLSYDFQRRIKGFLCCGLGEAGCFGNLADEFCFVHTFPPRNLGGVGQMGH